MDNKTNTPNQDNNSTTKKPIQLYLTVSLIVLTIISIILSSVCIGVVINKDKPTDDRTVIVRLNYLISTQFTNVSTYPIASLAIKTENPTFTDSTFNAGYGKSPNGQVTEFDLPIENPRMGEGYDVNTDYFFDGWFTEPEYLYEWNFAEDRLYHETTLYAKWTVKTW